MPDETQVMKYKLVTLPKNVARMPVLSVQPSAITLTVGGQQSVITPTTVNFAGGNNTYGYTAILSDSDVADIVATRGARNQAASVPQFIGDSEAGDSTKSVSVVGRRFQVVAKPQPIETKTATITIIGNETGGVQTISLTVNKENLSSNILERAVY